MKTENIIRLGMVCYQKYLMSDDICYKITNFEVLKWRSIQLPEMENNNG